MKKVIKDNKVLFALSIVIFISLIAIIIGLFRTFYSNEGSKYGDRLDGIKDYPISETIDEDIKSLYTNGVESVSVEISGKIIYIIMDVSAGTSKDVARGYGVKSLEKFSEEEKSFYDIHISITCKNEAEETTMYPMMGSKRAGSPQIIWTNN